MSARLTICHVWDGDYPWDVRAQKVSQALTDAGHDVHLVARNTRGDTLVERLPEATVHRLAPLRGVPGSLSRASMFPAFLNPRWLSAILRTCRTTGSRVIIVRDLPLAVTAVWAGRMLGLPVVFDMAESYPEMLQSRWDTGRLRWSDHFTRNPRAARAIERWVLPRMDAVWVVVQESGDRVVRLGARRDRVSLVSNTPPRRRLDGEAAVHDGRRLEIVYLGLLEIQRGLSTALDAMQLLRERGVAFHLTLFGDGVDASLLRAQSDRLGLGGAVEFRGRVPNHEAIGALPRFHVGLVPHWSDASWNTTVPNKLFDYMAAGVIPVTSNTVPCVRVVQGADAGRVFLDRDAASLASSLAELSDPGLRRRLAANARAAIAREHNWEMDVMRMIQSLNAVTVSTSGLSAPR